MLKALAQAAKLASKAKKVTPVINTPTGPAIISQYEKNDTRFLLSKGITNLARKISKNVYGKEYTSPILSRDEAYDLTRQSRKNSKNKPRTGTGKRQIQQSNLMPASGSSAQTQAAQAAQAAQTTANQNQKLVQNKLDSAVSLLTKATEELKLIRQKLYEQNSISVKFGPKSQATKDLSDISQSSKQNTEQLKKVSDSIDKISSEKEERGSTGGITDTISDAADMISRRGRGAGRTAGTAARTAGSAARFARGVALPALAATAGAYGVDAIAGAFGVGEKQIDEKADQDNWNRMSVLQKAQSGVARGVENFGDFMGLSRMSNEARANRVRSESEYFGNQGVQNFNRMLGDPSRRAQSINVRDVENQVAQSGAMTGAQDQTRNYQMPDTSLGETPTAIPARQQNVQENLQRVKKALADQGITDPNVVQATLANVMKESQGKNVGENLNYGNTSNERIRNIFGSRAAKYTDEELNQIKKDPEKMGELMYGSGTEIGRKMENLEEGEGYKFRGRGFIQITGKKNYARASQDLFGDDRLVKNPDLLNDADIAAKASAWYMKDTQKATAKMLGIDPNNMTPEQAQLLATSQIAGRDVRTMGDYGKELQKKVASEASGSQVQSAMAAEQRPVAQPTAVASAKIEPTTNQSMSENMTLSSAPSPDTLTPSPRRTGEIIQSEATQLASTKDESSTGGGSPTIINNNNTNQQGGAPPPPPQQQVASVRNEENSIVRMQNMIASQAML